jgi:two-component system chemotaxis sensor kinase CheA
MLSGHPELLQEFVNEAREHLALVGEDVLNLEKEGSVNVQDCIDRLFRAMHSVKGGAAVIGCQQIKELAHLLETILGRVRQGQLDPNPVLANALLAGTDLIQTMLDDIEHSEELSIVAVVKRLEELVTLPSPERAAATVFDPSEPPEVFHCTLEIDLGSYVRRTGRSLLKFFADLQSLGKVLDARLLVPNHDLKLGLPEGPVPYECSYASAVPPDALAARLLLAHDEIQAKGQAPEPMMPVDTPLSQVPPPAQGSAAASVRPAAPEAPSTVRIGVQILDRLMTLAGELVLARNQALRAVEPYDAPMMRQVVQRLNAITTDMQQAVLLTRMQPVSILFGKFPRLVRDLSRQLGKQIQLSLRGTEVELDKTILEALSDPLTHLVRNCCDHGIELPSRRIAAGKNPEGQIILQARHEGGQIRIELRDDGKGIDAEMIRRKALEKGLKTSAELAAMKDTEVQALILLPGFSTAEKVTELSGRGVGMDVVKTNVEQLGGSLHIESTPGAGTCISLRLPLTLAIIPCLIVRSGGERYAIPQRDLEELVCISAGEVACKVEFAYDQEVYRLRQRLLPLVRLSEVLIRLAPFTATTRAEIHRKHSMARDISPAGDQGERNGDRNNGIHFFFAVVKVGSQRFGLVVDELLNTEEVVVKPMHSVLKPLRIYSGSTIMGDGRVALILDIEGIARHAAVSMDIRRERARAAASEQAEEQSVLLFEYGPHEQFAVPLAMVRRIEEIQVSHIEHVGGHEFLTLKGQAVPVVRLDQYMQVSSGPDQKTMYLLLPKHLKQPMGILLSKIIDTESLEIQLDTQTYRDDGIMGTAVVRGRLTLFLDLFRLGDRVAAQSKAVDPATAVADARRRPSILLVEDTQFFRQLVKSYLESQGYAVVIASNGVAGLQALAGQRFDLIVSDIEMPEMDGWRFARAVREDLGLRSVPMLALTTLSSEQDRGRALECGFNELETKLDRESFLARTKSLLKDAPAVASPGRVSHG